MPPGSGRTLCGDRARCGVEMNGDTHIRSPGYPIHIRAPRHVCVRVYGGCITEEHPRRGPFEYPNPSRGGDPRHTTRSQRENLHI